MAEVPAGLLTRAASAGKVLVGAHVELAQQEAARDASRVGGAVVVLLVCCVLAVTGLLLVDVALIDLVRGRYGLGWGPAALWVALGHAVLALPLGLYALGRLKQPVLKRTRGRVKETVTALRGA